MKNIKELLLEMVAVNSETGTLHEADMAAKLLSMIKEDEYFAKHPELCGAWDGNDILGRPVIWALKKGTGDKTVVFSGHYDTVGTSAYGVFEPYCRQPELLRENMRKAGVSDTGTMKEDLADPDWMFGRGAADMKAGLAIGMAALFAYEPGEVNILYTATSDEENLSAGARQAVGLYLELKKKFHLEYIIGVEGEPGDRNVEKGEPVALTVGSAGKILPIAVAKGVPAHGAKMLSGINSAHIISRLVQLTEYNTKYVSADGGKATQPPAVQLLRDMKEGYDVSMPEYTCAAFNMSFFMKTDPAELLSIFCGSCAEAMESVLADYEECFKYMIDAGHVQPEEYAELHPVVMTLEELEDSLEGNPEFEAYRKKAKVACAKEIESGETMLLASCRYIRDIMAFSGIPAPLVVVGVAPPYYPAMNCDYLGDTADEIIKTVIDKVKDNGPGARKVDYSYFMTDQSYFNCKNPESALEVVKNIPVPKELYSMDVEAMSELNIPIMLIGAAYKCIHQIGERVYLPDLEKYVPEVYMAIVEAVEEMN